MNIRFNGRAAGFTLVEVLVALFIVATTIAALQEVSNGSLRGSVETNRLRIAKMLLHMKAEEVSGGGAAAIGSGGAGEFPGYPNYTWEAVASEVPLPPPSNPNPNQPAPDTPETVMQVTVTVRYPTFGAADVAVVKGEQLGALSLVTYIDPPDAQLQPKGQPGVPGQPPPPNP